MKDQLVIHIGLRKTGSSALQELLAREGVILRENKISYPARLTRFPAHQELAWSLMRPIPPYFTEKIGQDEVYGHYCKIIEENIDGGMTTLLSSEDLSLLTFDFKSLEAIKYYFGKYAPKIVLYARNPISYHVSNYKHALIAGRETRSFSEYIFNANSVLYSQYSIVANVWRGVFGKEAVKVLPYDKKRFQEQSIFSCFLGDVFKVQVKDKFLTHRSNTGIPNGAVGFMLELNRSDLSDESLKIIKNAIRKIQLPASDDDFLDQNVSAEEKRIIRMLA